MKNANFSGIVSLSVRYANKNNCTKKEALETVKSVIECLREELLESSDGVQIIDFITLRKVVRKSSIGRVSPYSPELGSKVIPARVKVKAVMSKQLSTELQEVFDRGHSDGKL